MALEVIVMQIVLCMIAFVANLLSAFSGGGAGLVQLPALILLGLPFSMALATHKVASVALGLGAGLRHIREGNLKISLVFLILCCGLPGVWFGAQLALFIPSEFGSFVLGLLTFCLGLYSIRSPQLGISAKVVKTNNAHCHSLKLIIE